MSTAVIHQVQPVLPTQDVRAAIQFYVERLGFKLAFQDNPEAPGYAGVRRDGVELHLQWHDAKEWAQVERPSLRFVVADVDTLYGEFANKGLIDSERKPYRTDWNTYEFAFFDPDKNGLTFYQDA